jgi:hypothetical protein
MRVLHYDGTPITDHRALHHRDDRDARARAGRGAAARPDPSRLNRHHRSGRGDMHVGLNTVAQALNTLGVEELCPGADALVRINAGLR